MTVFGRVHLIAVGALWILAFHAPQSQEEVFEVKAEYLSYGDLNGSWELTLKAPGGGSLLVYKRIKDGKRPISVPPERLAALRSVVKRERFLALQNQYGAMVVDGPERRMEIRQGRKAKKVTIFSIGEDLSQRE